MPDQTALARLAEEARRQLSLLDYPRHPWVPSRGEGVLDVAIVGAGQTGLVTAFGLLRERVQRVTWVGESDRVIPLEVWVNVKV